MEEQSAARQIEARWPVMMAIVAGLALLALLPGRIKLIPTWSAYAVGLAVLAPVLAVGLTGGSVRWLRIERVVTMLFAAGTAAVNVANLGNLTLAIAKGSTEIGGLQLFGSSIALWVTNTIMFSVLYWQLDRGGPEARLKRTGVNPDWLFPEEGAPEGVVPDGWRPTFVCYLYLGYSTATAFSTTEVLPMTSRAKMLMMLESAISLGTIVVVAARAINILGS
jgi:hypothetical protein